MEKPLKIETRPIYIYSMLTVFISIVLAGLVSAFTMKYMWNLNLNTTGCWITCLSILLFGLTSWTNPDSIPGWGASGIDEHPEKENFVLSSYEYKQYPLWQQPNRLKLTITIYVFFIGALFQALGATLNF